MRTMSFPHFAAVASASTAAFLTTVAIFKSVVWADGLLFASVAPAALGFMAAVDDADAEDDEATISLAPRMPLLLYTGAPTLFFI